MIKKLTIILLCLSLLINLAGCSKTESADLHLPKTPAHSLSLTDLRLTVGLAPGPPTYPLAYLAEKNSQISLKPWQSGDQLMPMLSSKEVQLSSCPITNALIAYNKGLGVQVLDIAVWGMLYVMSTEPDIKCLEDLKGEEIVVSGKGGLPDLVFQHLLLMNNIDPQKDLSITYLDMSQASVMIASGQIKHAIFNEPNSSIAKLNALKNNIQLNRVLDLTTEWQNLPGQENIRLPMGSIVVVNGTDTTPEEIAAFEKNYFAAAEWVNTHPAEIGPLVEKYVPWMKAAAVNESVKYARLDPKPAIDCQAEVEAFFTELSKTANPSAYGGKLPDAKFYYQSK